MPPLRLVFMGTPSFAVPALKRLYDEGHQLLAVYCQPPKPAGRGQSLRKTDVHLTAEDLNLPVRYPLSLRSESEQKALADLAPDVIVVAAYGLILPQAVLAIPRFGCLNIHGSLLPRWRGAAPIHRALLAGDEETGITIMQMEAGLDTGPMLLKKAIPITKESTAESLHDALADLGATLIVEALEKAAEGKLTPSPQNEAEATYAEKLTREDGLIDWRNPASFIERQVRAMTPWPGTFFKLEGERIKVLKAEPVSAKAEQPGLLLDREFTVSCGQEALRLTLVQRGGKTPTDGASLLRGLRLSMGYKLS